MRAIDTNVLIRLLTRDDRKQTEAAEKCVAMGAWVSQLVLLEAAWVLGSVYDADAQRIANAIAMLLEHERIAVQDADVVAAALAQFQARPTIGFSDCLIYENARKAGHVPLATFDRELSKLQDAERI